MMDECIDILKGLYTAYPLEDRKIKSVIRKLKEVRENLKRVTEMQRVTLDPCPFCGEVTMVVAGEYEDKFYICCLTCYAQGPVHELVEGAIDLWNRRITP